MRNEANSGDVISRCCSLQDSLGPPDRRRIRRVHGLQLPLHPQQVVGWLVLFVIAINTFAVLTPLLKAGLRPLLSSIIAAILAIHVFSHLTVLLLDPAEAKVRSQPTNKVVPKFDRSKHLHVIENGWCHLCNIVTSSKRTKHCPICNKCVARFDHHCMWLNNCIGGRNYAAFLACLISAVLAAIFVAGLSATELLVSLFILPGSRGGERNLDIVMENATIPVLPVPGTGSLIVISAVGILSAIAAVLLIHLCFFHGYIGCLGLSTHEYVRNKRERNAIAAAAAAAVAAAATASSSNANTSSTNSSSNADDPNHPPDATTARTTILNIPGHVYRACEKSLTTGGAGSGEACRQSYRQPNEEEEFDSTIAQETRVRSERRNFRLCFSYEARSNETSFELSSRTILTDPRQEAVPGFRQSPDIKLATPTPSPVSCCFFVGPSTRRSGGGSREKSRAESSKESNDSGRSSCSTIRRIRTFLRARLRKNVRRRVSNSSTDMSRIRKSKLASIAGSSDCDKEKNEGEVKVEVEGRDLPIATLKEELPLALLAEERPVPLAPVKLPPLAFLPEQVSSKLSISAAEEPRGDTIPNSFAISIPILPPVPDTTISRIDSTSGGTRTIPTQTSLAAITRNVAYARARRSCLRKRPRFKMNSHLAQTVQLSPILEAELSKPASPRSPPHVGRRFSFPASHE